ncbi:uncharacterized protein LOC111618573 [Centruroides sculpturatus]|uniref:uncharacterized protein LOC111618573 n=1 Tax=Centruroides sculpturatus TaxID=218467 RepID=UPI000C6D175A|nr:uncharacterized protein LOC111618573 [Centruroides sculpturatus]
MDRHMRIFMALITTMGFMVCLIIALSLSSLASAMEDSFQEIRIFSSVRLKLKYKLKLLNFMKRFAKASLRMTIGGYFDVTKKFPIKMSSFLYSISSSLLELRSLQDKQTKCTKPSKNDTFIFL